MPPLSAEIVSMKSSMAKRKDKEHKQDVLRHSTEVGEPSTPKRTASSYLDNSNKKYRLSELLVQNVSEIQRVDYLN